MQEPAWLTHVQLVLSSVTSICAVVGLGYAYHDWMYWKAQPEHKNRTTISSSIPLFALICGVGVFYSPVRFSQLLNSFELSPTAEGLFRATALLLLLVYFMWATVRRYGTFGLTKSETIKKTTSVFFAMILVATVGFYR